MFLISFNELISPLVFIKDKSITALFLELALEEYA